MDHLDPHEADFVLEPPGSSFSFILFILSFSICLSYLSICLSYLQEAAAESFGTQCCKKLLFSAFNARADDTVITYSRSFCKFEAWCSNHIREPSFLPATPITVSLYLNHLLELSLSSSTVHSALHLQLIGFIN